MLFELREYHCMPGRIEALLARFRDHTFAIWDRLGIRVAGFYVPAAGEAGPELVYLLAWNTLAEREASWRRFLDDEEWLRVKAETEADGPLVSSIRTRMLEPAHAGDRITGSDA